MKFFDHEKLDVYQAALSFILLIDEMVELLPKGRAYLADQLLRAGTSVALNIAEGAGEYSGNEKI
jgi:four helix bundle protein